MTMASSTTKPTDRVSAMRVMLLTEKPRAYMAAKVPTMESGSARLGMSVAETLRRKRKITIITRAMVSSRVNLTSVTDSRIDSVRSKRMLRLTEPGSWLWNEGICCLMASTTSMVLTPGCRWMARTMARVDFPDVLYQAAILSFSTLSLTWATSCNRTGAPPRQATISDLKAAASNSRPEAWMVN